MLEKGKRDVSIGFNRQVSSLVLVQLNNRYYIILREQLSILMSQNNVLESFSIHSTYLSLFAKGIRWCSLQIAGKSTNLTPLRA